MALFFSFCLPSRKAGGLQIPCCQGIAVADYSFILDALALKPSSFYNVGVYAVSCVFSAIGVIHQSISMGCRGKDGKLRLWRKTAGVVMNGLRWRWRRMFWVIEIAPWNGFHWYWPPENHCGVARINMDSPGSVCITEAEEALGYKKDIRFSLWYQFQSQHILGKGQQPGIVVGYFFIWAVFNNSYYTFYKSSCMLWLHVHDYAIFQSHPYCLRANFPNKNPACYPILPFYLDRSLRPMMHIWQGVFVMISFMYFLNSFLR